MSISFTSGQKAESESIDLNHGTITQAKLTSTEVSGSFDYQMSTNYFQPIRHYKLNDDAANTTVIDYGSDGVNATADFNTEDNSVVGKIDKAISNSDASGEDIALNTIIDVPQITIAFWVNQDESLTNWRRLFESGGYAKGGYSIQTGIVGSDRVDLYLGSAAGWNTSVGTEILRNVWTHIIFTFDGSTARVYKNNSQINSTGATYTSPTNTPNNFLSNNYNGAVEDFRVYDYVLTEAQRDIIYNSSAGTYEQASWEAVSSGVSHSFTYTGADLRWRATENNSSTGEISQITVEDYH